MKTLKVTIHFREPFRVIEWHKKEARNSAPFLRGYSFARWHKSNENGRPYITGTLVRSAMIQAVEQLLWLHNGNYNGETCCPGQFLGSKAKVYRKKKAARLRRRQTLTWKNGKDICANTAENPCLFCLLLGRCDEAKEGDFTEGDNKKRDKRFDVKFTNFDLPSEQNLSLQQLATSRILNRVDQQDGKAEDFFKIWEIDHEVCGSFTGDIHLSDRAEKVEALLRDAAAIVNTISGALCWIEIDGDTPIEKTTDTQGLHSRVTPDAPEEQFREWAKEVRHAFEDAGKAVHLRKFADVVRELRRLKPDHSFPAGHTDRNGKTSDHFIWDIPVFEKKKLRSWLPEKFKEARKDGYSWRRFSEDLGQALYVQSKQAAPEHFTSDRPVGSGQSIQITKAPHTELVKAHRATLCEYLIKGRLVAETPFFFGWCAEGGEAEHTNLQILTTSDGNLRLPRSALRGILRRDLKIAFETGCRAELGHASPCACPVCALMRQITIKDSRTDYKEPPQIRHRIRIDANTGTVAQGALFDMEVGPKGISFPFEMRLRSQSKKIPKKLQTVLAWWGEGKATFSGGSSIGKGRFKLDDLEYTSWNLQDKNDFDHYKEIAGGRRQKTAEIGFDELNVSNDAEYLWKKKDLEFSVESPFLTGDPIAVLLDDAGTDAACYQSIYVGPNGEERKEYLLKSESFRGLLRTAVGRRNVQAKTVRENGTEKTVQVPVLELDHEECNCILCRLFGNQQEAGKVRVEDFIIEGDTVDKTIDRVAIDRFTGGAKDKHKFDMTPLVGTPKHPLEFTGELWVHNDVGEDDRGELEKALTDIQTGLYPLGGLGNIGLGWVKSDREGGIKPQSLSIAGNGFKPMLNNSNVYWPHYFLSFAEAEVKREKEPPGHAYLKDQLHTGRLVCTLKTKTPLIIPNLVDEMKKSEEDENHKFYPFFNLNGEICIPSSEIKGMISSCFEALTNSCLRVFDEKKRLSWRMEANPKVLKGFEPGRVTDDGICIEKMKEYRFPSYDKSIEENEDQREYFKWDDKIVLTGDALEKLTHEGLPSAMLEILNNLKDEEFSSQKDFLERIKDNADTINLSKKEKGRIIGLAFKHAKGKVPRYNHPTPTDSMLLSLAGYNRSQKQAEGQEKSYSVIKPEPKCNADFMFVATPLVNGQKQQKNCIARKSVSGYLKITGPNKVEKKNGKSSPELVALPKEETPVVLGDVDLQKVFVANAKKRKERDRLIPQYIRYDSEEDATYTMTKRCERVFVRINSKPKPIASIALEKFEILVNEYRVNAEQQKTPKIFQTRLPQNGKVNPGDLLYFREENSKAVELIPVRISRTVDDLFLGHKVRDDFRPCVREILDEEYARKIKEEGIKEIFQHHPKGLCPACSLFGTGFYKGRIGFGFAFPKEGTTPQLENAGNYITLPLLERPRPTWSMPRRKRTIGEKTKGKGNGKHAGPRKVGAKKVPLRKNKHEEDRGDLVPGRKFYVHHQGWKNVLKESSNESQTENNRSVQAIASDQEFTFEIRFENLRDWELGLMIYALNLEPGMAHKLGMGKPLGFGSVAIQVEKIISEKTVDMSAISESAKAKLMKFWDAASENEATKKLKDLFDLLHYQEDDAIQVRYPALRQEDDPEKKPGYVELGKKDGPFDPRVRQSKLKGIWSPWD